MEPESSLPYSQAPATRPNPEPTPSSPHNPFPPPKDPFYVMPNSFIYRRQPFQKICRLHIQKSFVLTSSNETKKTKDKINSELTS